MLKTTLVPVCETGIVEGGKTCDDGNDASDDGSQKCSKDSIILVTSEVYQGFAVGALRRDWKGPTNEPLLNAITADQKSQTQDCVAWNGILNFCGNWEVSVRVARPKHLSISSIRRLPR